MSDFQPIFDSISEDIMTMSAGAGGKSPTADWNDILKFIMQLHSRNPFTGAATNSQGTKPQKLSQSSV